ncbi:MAG: carbohydrate-binding protein [Fibrobacteres bacterium]|nr:carbohydrate-binding protein [Fibrobacterota bacterium]
MKRHFGFGGLMQAAFIVLISAFSSRALPPDFSLTNIMPSVVRGTSILQTSDSRLFVTELGGALKTCKNGSFYTIHQFPTSNARSEQGLFGLAADPNYASNGYMYVHYFVYVNGADQDYHVIMRFTVSPALGGNPQFVAGSERLVYRLPNLPAGDSRHNGGQIVFGNDGYLYMPKGEGEHQEQAENLANVFGKLIRIDANATTASNDDVNGHYGIPPGNPGFAKPEIFAYGFRNPWSMTKDPSTGDMYIGDVGGSEEINRIVPSQAVGKRFGWGPGGNSGMYNCGDPAFVCPMHTYNGGAITGVAVKRNIGSPWPAQFQNAVFFSDHNGSWIKYTPIGQSNPQLFNDDDAQPLGLTFGSVDGNMYYCKYNGEGGLWQVRYDGTVEQTPVFTSHPQNATVNSGRQAILSATATGGNLVYQWQSAPSGSVNFANLANNAVFSGVNTASLTINATESQTGRYRVQVSNGAGSAASNFADLTVLPPNGSPVISFISPAQGAFFTVPETINFSATASDPEQGSLPASAFHWELELGHRTSATVFHTHPVTVFDGVTSGSFASTVAGEPSSQVWLFLILTVTDNAGNTDKDTLTLNPNKTTLRAESDPPGLDMVLMDLVKTNVDVTAVIGNSGKINANTPQTINGVRYDFSNWSFSGDVPPELNTTATFQNFTVRGNPATFVAHYTAAPTNTLQAENATFAGPVFGNGYAGFHGTGFLDYQNATGDYIEWKAPASTAGSYTLSFRYAHAGGNRPLKLTVNGADVAASLAFPATGAFTTWSTVSSTQNLVAGNNTIRLTAIGSSGGNFDELTYSLNGGPVTPPPGGGGTPYAIRAVNGQYASLQPDNRIIPNAAAVTGNNPLFSIGDNGDGTVSLKASGNGMYCRVTAPDADVTCDAAGATASEAKWTRIDNGDGAASLKNMGTLNYLVAEGGGAQALKANRAGISDWEKFTLTAQTPPTATQYGITMTVADGSGTLTPAAGTTTMVNQGANLSITATPAAGFVFAHWHTSVGTNLASTTSASTQVLSVSQNGTVEAHFDPATPPPTGGTAYALRAVNAQYASLQADNRIIPNAAAVAGNNPVFEIGSNGDATVYLKALGNGMFCRSIALDADVTCDAPSVSADESRWTRIDNADGTASFKNMGTLGHLVSEGGGSQPLKANRANISDWEKFTLAAQSPPPTGTQYGITMNVAAGTGTLTPAAGTTVQVNQGSNLSITAAPGAGYVFGHWTASAGLTLASATSASTQVTSVGQNGTVAAYFDAAPPQTSVVLPAENAVWSGPALVANHAGYHGSGFLDYTNASNDYIEWTAQVANAGTYNLAFRYAQQAGNRPLKLTVNGMVVAASLPFPTTGSWDVWTTQNASAGLTAGGNTIRLTAIGSSGGNIDELTVSIGGAAKQAATSLAAAQAARYLGVPNTVHSLSSTRFLPIGLDGNVDDNAGLDLQLVSLEGKVLSSLRAPLSGLLEYSWDLGEVAGLKPGLYYYRMGISGLAPKRKSGKLILLP